MNISNNDDISVICANCNHIICRLNELVFVIKKDDILLTIDPNILDDFNKNDTISFAARDTISFDQTIKCNGCNGKLGSEILLNSKGETRIICFGVTRFNLFGIAQRKNARWRSLYKQHPYNNIRSLHEQEYIKVSLPNKRVYEIKSLTDEISEQSASGSANESKRRRGRRRGTKSSGGGSTNASATGIKPSTKSGGGSTNASATGIKPSTKSSGGGSTNASATGIKPSSGDSTFSNSQSASSSFVRNKPVEYSKFRACSREERIFYKLLDLKSKDLVVNQEDALAFLAWLEVSQKKTECLFQLEDPDGLGTLRIEQIVAMCVDTNKIGLLFIPLIDFFLDPKLEQPLFKTKRDRILLALFNIPYLVEKLAECCPDDSLGQGNKSLCKMLTIWSLSSLEARQSKYLRRITKGMVAMSIEGSQILSNVMIVNETNGKACNTKVCNTVPIEPGWRLDDDDPPGNRHDNDKYNFRDISIIPTSDEVICTRSPYLPLANQRNRLEGLADNTAFLLDYQFRLLRENFVSDLRENIASQRSLTGAYAIDVSLGDIKNPKPCVVFAFDVPPKLANIDRKDRRESWLKFGGLEEGTLVAFRSQEQVVRYGSVVVNDVDGWLNHEDGPRVGIFFDRKSDLLDVLSEIGLTQKYEIATASSNFFAVKPILECLQSMISIPLREELVDIVPYNIRPNLLPINITLPSDFGSVQINLNNWSAEAIQKSTTLDSSQVRALEVAFTSKVSLLQGPPGTGKSFIGSLVARTFLHNSKAKILCVCYTNHALDQFLECMLEADQNLRIARIGGRSKSKILEPYTLRNLTKNESRTFEVRRNMSTLYEKMNQVSLDIVELKKHMIMKLTWDHDLKDFLKYEMNDIYAQLTFNPVDDDEFRLVGPHGKELQEDYLWSCWIKGMDKESHAKMLFNFNKREIESYEYTIWNLTLPERQDLMNLWRQLINQPISEEIAYLFKKYTDLSKDLELQKRESYRLVLSKSRLIGATTTGAAKYKDLIEAASADVIIIEEAGEILEAQVLTCLTESTKQLILIGDHKQLRPKVDCFNLTIGAGKGYNLDCSLFERLVTTSNLPSSMLTVQHRMRPEISNLIRMSTYPELIDHPSVSSYPHVLGLSKDVIFLNHNSLEGRSKHSLSSLQVDKSKINLYEAELSVELIRLLLLQGYKQSQLVILTGYLGQLRSINLQMKKELKDVTALVSELDKLELVKEGYIDDDDDEEAFQDVGVRVSTVDNYQGEEADVVIISLVRSNDRGDIGFMSTPQRVNVMLSRAKHGMILIGNSNTLISSKKGSAIWTPIIDYFREAQSFLESIPSYCQLHPKDIVHLSAPGDFRKFRINGGCSLACTFRLLCGHSCPLKCHVFDKEHVSIKCFEECKRIPEGCGYNHSCAKLCHQQCGPCTFPVNTLLPCDHEQTVLCYQTSGKESINCTTLLTVQLSCTHDLSTYCSNITKGKAEALCRSRCLKKLSCGHACPGYCGNCKSGQHQQCQVICDKPLACGHRCVSICHEGTNCKPCENRCEVKCIHSECHRKCHQSCSPCVKNCDWECKHQGQCPLPCGAPCSRLPCDHRCDKTLSCGHICPSVCGEVCPPVEYCQSCGDLGDTMVDYITGASYAEVDLASDPILCLPCKHFFVRSTLDGHMELEKFYGKNSSDEWNVLIPTDQAIYLPSAKTCPECRVIVNNLKRYGRVTKFAELCMLDRKESDKIRLQISKYNPEDGNLKTLLKILQDVKKGPRRVLYEAARGIDIDVPRPSPSLLIKILLLIGDYYLEKLKYLNISNDSGKKTDIFREGLSYLGECQIIADSTNSTNSSANVRLMKGRLFNQYMDDNFNTNAEALRNTDLDWIIRNPSPGVTQEQKELARQLREFDAKAARALERATVIAAMGAEYAAGYGRGHWYECPNGHEYFIGNCGAAVSEGNCIECGLPIGGAGVLFSTNRVARNIN